MWLVTAAVSLASGQADVATFRQCSVHGSPKWWGMTPLGRRRSWSSRRVRQTWRSLTGPTMDRRTRSSWLRVAWARRNARFRLTPVYRWSVTYTAKHDLPAFYTGRLPRYPSDGHNPPIEGLARRDVAARGAPAQPFPTAYARIVAVQRWSISHVIPSSRQHPIPSTSRCEGSTGLPDGSLEDRAGADCTAFPGAGAGGGWRAWGNLNPLSAAPRSVVREIPRSRMLTVWRIDGCSG